MAGLFDVTECKIREVIHLTQLVPELQNILENIPKQLNLTCADLMADHDVESQTVLVDICSVGGYQINKSIMQCIARAYPPPAA